MFSTAAVLLWLALPLVGWFVRSRAPRHPVNTILIFIVVVATGSVLHVGGAMLLDMELKAAVDRFDRDHDGGLSYNESTPEAEEAMREYTSDTGRTFAPIVAFPFTLAYTGVWFVVLYPVSWIWGEVRGGNSRRRDISTVGRKKGSW